MSEFRGPGVQRFRVLFVLVRVNQNFIADEDDDEYEHEYDDEYDDEGSSSDLSPLFFFPHSAFRIPTSAFDKLCPLLFDTPKKIFIFTQ